VAGHAAPARAELFENRERRGSKLEKPPLRPVEYKRAASVSNTKPSRTRNVPIARFVLASLRANPKDLRVAMMSSDLFVNMSECRHGCSPYLISRLPPL